jgi:hypothetical protein
MYTRKSMLTVLIVGLVLMLVGSLAAKDNSMGIATKQTLTFTQPTIVGGTLLPAGDYNITHEMQGQNHIMIFKQIGGKAEVKANCKLTPLASKSMTTEQRFTTNASNQRVLVQMTFYGDKAIHVLEP